MAYVATAPTEYLADELAKVIDLPQSYKGLKVMFVPKAKKRNIQKSYREELQELNGSIKDDTFVECEDIPLENNLPRSIL